MKTGSDGSGYIYAKQLGHTVFTPLSALPALKADFSKQKLPAGVRIRCLASLFVDGVMEAQERGELQITDYGISGIGNFQFSRTAARALAENSSVQVSLDFKPDMSVKELEEYLKGRFQSIYLVHKKCSDSLTGFLPDKLAAAVLAQSGISPKERCGSCSSRPAFINGMERFADFIPGFNRYDAVLSGVESRTSSPVRIIRDEKYQSVVRGLYPCGEGAGYAGGIMSAAMDGMKVAEAVLKNS